MKKGWILMVCLLGFLGNAHSQKAKSSGTTNYWVMQLGVNYLNTFRLEPGIDLYLVSSNDNLWDLGVSGNFSYQENRLIVVPELSVAYVFNKKNSKSDPYSESFNASFYLLRTSISPWSITPEIGISVLNLFEFTVGYGISYSDHPRVNLDGAQLGLALKIPIQTFAN